jgi:hypothetical protein
LSATDPQVLQTVFDPARLLNGPLKSVLRRSAAISTAMLMAISGGVGAPSLRPTGPWRQVVSLGLTLIASRRSRRLALFCR